MTPSRIVLILLIATLAFVKASPIREEITPTLLIAVPIYVQDEAELESKLLDDSYPLAYAYLVGPQDNTESDVLEIQKRSVEDLDDLETAAGTNALRPLFVYRQQVAYRQRVREALRRGNRF